MKSPRSRIIAFALLASLCANARAGPLVLCTGPGGHLAVEPAFAGCCQSTPFHDTSVDDPIGTIDTTSGDHLDGCEGCQDLLIPISPSHESTPRIDQRGQLAQASLNGLRPPTCPALHVALSPPWGGVPLPLRGPLANLRTTVLRF